MKNKGKINYNLVNLATFIFIIYLSHRLNLLNKIFSFLLILTLSFIVSYILYPLYKKLSNKYNKIISIVLTYLIVLIVLLLFIYLIIPNSNLISKIVELFSNIMLFINKFSAKYNLNININSYLKELLRYIISNGVTIVKNFFNFASKFVLVIILSVCILLNIEYIKDYIKNNKHYKLLSNINIALRNYINANFKIILIQVLEYTIVFALIGHPNYLLLGLLNSINSFIPIFGSLITNTIALITSSVISTKLLILTSIVSITLPNIDQYIINPKIYKETNKISQTLSISTVIIFGILFGFIGILFAIPVLIVLIEIIKYKRIDK